MVRKIVLVLLLSIAVALIGIPEVLGISSYLDAFNAKYGTAGTRIDTCDLCHISGQPKSVRNPYGVDLDKQLINLTSDPSNASQTTVNSALTNIEPLDSDGDGFINIEEINNLTFPGNASDFPHVVVTGATFNISGFKINDTNGNGVWDTGEMGVENWNIKLLNATTGTEMANTTTNGNGFYNFMNLPNGTYNVTEEMKAGWKNTSAMSKVITLNGADAVKVNFTNQPVPLPPPPQAAFNISGFKINDTNGNGMWDPGEMGIENWNIKLLNTTTGTEMANTTTNGNGFYQFTNLAPGDYNVTEETKAGFTPTNATSSAITVKNMDIENINFTNQPAAPPSVIITSFELIPGKTTELKKIPISITIKALNNSALQTLFNGTASITITAKNTSAATFPPAANFTDGVATIEVNSDIAQFVTVTASSNGVNGSTKIMFADKIFNLIKGWNLISIPNFADPSNVNQMLQFVQNNGVVGYDPAINLFSTPTDLLPLFGYWINITADNQTLGFIASTNITSVPPSRSLNESWNLIGVSANRTDPDKLKAGELFAELKYGPDSTQWLYTRLVSYEQPLSPVTLVSGTGLSDSTELKQGSGYWLFIKNIPSTDQNNVPWAGKQW